MKQLLILSGKGGTGKTTIASAFIKLAKAKAYADCDVDAPNLHLVIDKLPEAVVTDYYGLDKAVIDPAICSKCDLCRQNCRFNAIYVDDDYIVDYYGCEGCSVCEFVCPENAIRMQPAVAGELMLYKGDAIFSTAQLKMGSGNSGLLVTDVKKQLKRAAKEVDFAIVDGSPGIGCPVIASLSGVDMVLIVAEPSVSGISDLERIIKTAKNFQIKIAVCINKYDTNMDNTKSIKDFCEENNLFMVGNIPFDKEAVTAVNAGQTIVDIECTAGRAVRDVYEKVLGILNNDK